MTRQSHRHQRQTATESRNITHLPWTQIRIDGGTQARLQLDSETVTRYADEMRRGDIFPPVVVYYDGEAYWLGDGFHRHKAHSQAHGSGKEIATEVRQGTRRDAILCAVGANATHGLPRTNQDKRNAIATLLRDEEWSQWSDREIARVTHTTHPTVAKVRAALAGPTGKDYQSKRRGADGRTIDTANIGNNRTELHCCLFCNHIQRHGGTCPRCKHGSWSIHYDITKSDLQEKKPLKEIAAQGEQGDAPAGNTDKPDDAPVTDRKAASWNEEERLNNLVGAFVRIHTELNNPNLNLTAENYGFGQEYERLRADAQSLRDEIRQLTPEDKIGGTPTK